MIDGNRNKTLPDFLKNSLIKNVVLDMIHGQLNIKIIEME
jgi:hypothetical protein